jgi:hypothetical protein
MALKLGLETTNWRQPLVMASASSDPEARRRARLILDDIEYPFPLAYNFPPIEKVPRFALGPDYDNLVLAATMSELVNAFGWPEIRHDHAYRQLLAQHFAVLAIRDGYAPHLVRSIYDKAVAKEDKQPCP